MERIIKDDTSMQVALAKCFNLVDKYGEDSGFLHFINLFASGELDIQTKHPYELMNKFKELTIGMLLSFNKEGLVRDEDIIKIKRSAAQSFKNMDLGRDYLDKYIANNFPAAFHRLNPG